MSGTVIPSRQRSDIATECPVAEALVAEAHPGIFWRGRNHSVPITGSLHSTVPILCFQPSNVGRDGLHWMVG